MADPTHIRRHPGERDEDLWDRMDLARDEATRRPEPPPTVSDEPEMATMGDIIEARLAGWSVQRIMRHVPFARRLDAEWAHHQVQRDPTEGAP